MQKLFTEFENENALRTYPFASGCTVTDTKGDTIGIGTLIDAALYPLNPNGPLYISKIGKDGVVSISDSDSVVMTATLEDGAYSLEFYDTTVMHRHSGTLIAKSAEALSTLVNVYTDRVFTAASTAFSSSCVFPIVNDGVISVDVSSTGPEDGEIRFTNGNRDVIRISTDSYGSKLRFDVIPVPKEVNLSSIQHIYCIVDGKTPFRIMKIPFADEESGNGNTIAVYLDNIDRQSICGNAHREESLETKDNCDCDESSSPCKPEIDPPEDIPAVYQTEVVDIPNGAYSAFYLASPNMTGYDNPISITLIDSAPEPITEIPVDANSDNIELLKNKLKSKGVVIQIPGLGA